MIEGRTERARLRSRRGILGFALLTLSVLGLAYVALVIGAGAISLGAVEPGFGLVDYLEVVSVGLIGFGLWRSSPWAIPVAAWLVAGILGFMTYWLLTSSHAGSWQAVDGLHSFLLDAAAPWWWQMAMAVLVAIGWVAAITDPARRARQSQSVR